MYHGLGNHFGCTQWNSYVTWVKCKLVSVHLEIVLILTHDRWAVCTECTISLETILGATNCTPRWRGLSGNSFWAIWRYYNLDARYVHGLRWMDNRLRNHFWCSWLYSLAMWIKRKVISIHLEIVWISEQDWCTVCVECTAGMQIILGTPNGTPRW
jgi:hypothetical protein